MVFILRKIILTIVIPIIFFSYSSAQKNLVLNPSFEEYEKLPTGFANNGISFAQSWYIPNRSSPDYFNLDCDTSYLSLSNSYMNFDSAHTGSACVGIVPFMWNGYMEHITGKLSTPLIKGTIYKVSFWIKYSGDVCQFSTDCIGLLFSREKFYFFPVDPFYESINRKQIVSDIETLEGCFFDNGNEWVELNFLYKSYGGERYITIGKFYNSKIDMKLINYYKKAEIQFTSKREKFINKGKNQKILRLNKNFNDENGDVVRNAYYFIDDVSVIATQIVSE